MNEELLVLYGLIIVGGACLSRWVSVYGVAIASVGLGMGLAVATYGGYLPPLHALISWALFQIAYGIAAVLLDRKARRFVLDRPAYRPADSKGDDPQP
jgi:hypothetical protein